MLDSDEYIIRIYGTFGDYVDSIYRISTNKRIDALSGTIGGGGGDGWVRYEAPNGYMISGFFGRADIYLDAIGVYYSAVSTIRPTG